MMVVTCCEFGYDLTLLFMNLTEMTGPTQTLDCLLV
jgi:hypothetical protein